MRYVSCREGLGRGIVLRFPSELCCVFLAGPGGGAGPGPSSCGVHARSGGGEQGHVEEKSAAPPKKRRPRAGCGRPVSGWRSLLAS